MAGGPPQPDLANVHYLPDHESAADLSTSITDLATGGTGNPHVFTYAGNAQNSTADSAFGSGSSILLDGTGDWITRTYHIDFRPSSLDALDSLAFCWELNFKLAALAADSYLYTRYNAATNRRFWQFRVLSTGALNFIGSTNGISATNLCNITSSAGLITTGTWYHAAVVREKDVNPTDPKDEIRIYLDGVNVGSASINGTNGFFADANIGPRFGADNAGVGALNGRLDNLRITMGEHVYTSDFTPPSSRHPTS